LTGVNPHLLTPITTVPENWPLPAAVWRRELRGRLMFTRWITYTAAPRSLRVGTQGQAWLAGTSHDPKMKGHPVPTPGVHRVTDPGATDQHSAAAASPRIKSG